MGKRASLRLSERCVHREARKSWQVDSRWTKRYGKRGTDHHSLTRGRGFPTLRPSREFFYCETSESEKTVDLRFQTTRWSIVNAAGAGDSAARSALTKLCETYWYPLYAYVRRRGATRTMREILPRASSLP